MVQMFFVVYTHVNLHVDNVLLSQLGFHFHTHFMYSHKICKDCALFQPRFTHPRILGLVNIQL